MRLVCFYSYDCSISNVFHGMGHVHFGHLDLINVYFTGVDMAKNGQNLSQSFTKWHKNIRMAKILAKEKNPSVNSAHLALVIF